MNNDYIVLGENISLSKSMLRKIGIASAIILFVAVVIICIVVNVTMANQPSNMIKVDNYGELPLDPPAEVKGDLSSRIYNILAEHFGVQGAVDANIRSGTAQNTSEGDVSSETFVLDVDEYQQSYDVYISWSDKIVIPENIGVECTLRQNSKYPDEKCYGTYYDSDSPHQYLPYESNLTSGEPFAANYAFEDSYGFEHITVTVQDCGNTELKEVAVLATKNYLKNTAGLDPEQFIYQRVSNNSKCNK